MFTMHASHEQELVRGTSELDSACVQNRGKKKPNPYVTCQCITHCVLIFSASQQLSLAQHYRNALMSHFPVNSGYRQSRFAPTQSVQHKYSVGGLYNKDYLTSLMCTRFHSWKNKGLKDIP